ncbi:MAG TPA: hypothetical protein VE987_11270 [Polyangiaceae bacterium]|nr:hypothetical protein [Polyangiaceae bacterium]
MPPTPPPADPEGQQNAAQAATNYADMRRMRDARRWGSQAQIPQGENSLVHAWAYAVTTYPAYGFTIWLKRVEPVQGGYEFHLTGEQLAGGDYPDRRLYEEVRRFRRQPSVAERFVGRIRALTPDGSYVDLGAGELSLPPEPTAQPTAWADPGSAWGRPPGSPWGAPPPWAMGAMVGGGWGPMPWGNGGFGYGMMGAPPPGSLVAMQQEIAQLKAQISATPPAAIAGHPELVEMWKMMNETISQSQRYAQAQDGGTTKMLLEFVLANMAKSNTPVSSVDPFSMLERIITVADKLRPPASGGGERPGIVIHDVGGTKLVEDKDGNLDTASSAVLSVLGDAKDALKAVSSAARARIGWGGGARPPAVPPSGAQPPRANGAAPPATTKAPPVNGTAPKALDAK